MSIKLPSFASKVCFNSDDDQAIFTLVEKLSGLAAGWKNLGLELGILIDKLDEIGAVVVEDSSVIKLQKTLQYWKDNGAREKRTWGFLADAASKAGNHALALEIRDRRDYSENAEVSLPLGELSEMLVDLTAAWKQLALQLCIPIYKQEEIAKPSTVGDCLGKILEVWVTGTGTATLEVLIRALESHAVGNPALAQELMNDIDIFKQLVPASDEDKGSVQKQLDDYISTLKK